MTKEILFLINELRSERAKYINYVSPTFETCIGMLSDRLDKTQDAVLARQVYNSIMDFINEEDTYQYIYVRVAFISVLKDIDYTMDVYDYIINTDRLTMYNKYYLLYQIGCITFTIPEVDVAKVEAKADILFKQICDWFAVEMNIADAQVPYKDRNHKNVVVLTEQFIALEHGPTKTALDRCRTLIKELDKELLLINTAECITDNGYVPLSRPYGGSYLEDYNDLSVFEWKDVSIPFFQLDNNQPDINTIRIVLDSIKEFNPEMIITIGGKSIISGLCNRMYPVLTVGLCPSCLEHSETTYQTISHPVNEDDMIRLEAMGKGEEILIDGLFTSMVKPLSHHLDRTAINASADDFVISIIGGRLLNEMSEDFIDMLLRTPENVKLAIFGNVGEILEQHPELRKRVIFCDFVSDILAYIECTDLNVNPIRRGGGTSAVEALYMGVPVVTTNHGDVYANVGDDFAVKNYDEMQQAINRYVLDKDFYNAMSQKAKERAGCLLDTNGEFVKIYDEVIRREKIKWENFQSV